MTLTLSDLPYSHDALASNGMSKETLEYHHDIHHKAYVDNGNNLLKNTAWENKKIEDIIVGTYDSNNIVQNGIFNNVSQHWNHEQFWQMMTPKKVNIPSELENELINSFQSIEKFKEQFSAAGATQFGSGWCWLVKDKDNNLKITKTENGVNPICFGQTALLGCDVWEHSYYIDFRNKRPVYLSNFLENLVNWEYVASKL
ncbi:MAG: superoxide dismutase [Proteobacteria bacterium]|jgi:Fe-Mn family superoxide dismutase|nr:superoxide dismutase [Pseudomonadota bacterium]MDA1136134.1 superoxide dismutase [Pseudomonadota bacterium]|tara:strand:+ start:2534 stop:3133 length:600 start_codon:yes stop_codon:yes gene_type:complete